MPGAATGPVSMLPRPTVSGAATYRPRAIRAGPALTRRTVPLPMPKSAAIFRMPPSPLTEAARMRCPILASMRGRPSFLALCTARASPARTRSSSNTRREMPRRRAGPPRAPVRPRSLRASLRASRDASERPRGLADLAVVERLGHGRLRWRCCPLYVLAPADVGSVLIRGSHPAVDAELPQLPPSAA
jgi:hypothetical protein